MIELDWKSLLENYGDVVEKQGVSKCGLNDSFPNYAKFWGRHVLTNRDLQDPSKLKKDVQPEFEDIFNNHYGVFYQLTTAILQQEALIQKGYLQNQGIDISTPLYHLATAVDLAERTCFAILCAKGRIQLSPMDHEEFEARTAEFWSKKYSDNFGDFKKKYKPVNLPLHGVSDVVSREVPNWGHLCGDTFNKVRHYRNVFAHSLSPLKLTIDGHTYIPKESALHKYTQARWSSGSVDRNEYAPATEVISKLTQALITKMNELWEVLLEWMEELVPTYLIAITSYLSPSSASGEKSIIDTSALNSYTYSGERNN
ncbi:MAG: hypothetical protein IT322_07150 [Anaerolineae bacterium]|nr:hypothetical protein [Anaerolineae bacterium]